MSRRTTARRRFQKQLHLHELKVRAARRQTPIDFEIWEGPNQLIWRERVWVYCLPPNVMRPAQYSIHLFSGAPATTDELMLRMHFPGQRR